MELNQYIDHTKLGPFVSHQDIDILINEGLKYQFKSLCVPTIYVNYVSKALKQSQVLTCTVIGFPHGQHTKEVKAFETQQAVLDGADEIDMVINQSYVKEKNTVTCYEDIKAVVDAAQGKTVKVILETSNLTDDEVVFACQMATKAGANFVKTSTGFSSHGATIHHIKLMKENIGSNMEVKASGGISSYEDAISFIEAGATRLGTSKGVLLIQKENTHGNTSY
jgi:deoxyribose-phosphate aldolase